MTAYEYAKNNNLEDFYCSTSDSFDFYHGIHSGKLETNFVPYNLCHFSIWEKYSSFDRFANCQLVAVITKGVRKPELIVKWNKEKLVNDLKNTYKNIKVVNIKNIVSEYAEIIE